MEVPHYFKAGDKVLLKQRRIGKLLPRAMGPYQFVRYKAASCLTAEVQSVTGAIITCSSAHLIPWRGGNSDNDSSSDEELEL